MHCDDCKWWTTVGVDDWPHDGWGRCKLTVTNDAKPRHPTLAEAQDTDSWQACLYTAPEFGCVQFEPIERK